MSNKNNLLKEEDFISEKLPTRDFSADARKLAKNKRSQKGLWRMFRNMSGILSSN